MGSEAEDEQKWLGYSRSQPSSTAAKEDRQDLDQQGSTFIALAWIVAVEFPRQLIPNHIHRYEDNGKHPAPLPRFSKASRAPEVRTHEQCHRANSPGLEPFIA